MLRSCSRSFSEEEEEEEEEKEDGEIVDLADSHTVYVRFSHYKTYREIEYSSRNMMVYFRSSGFVSLEAFKMYYVMASDAHVRAIPT